MNVLFTRTLLLTQLWLPAIADAAEWIGLDQEQASKMTLGLELAQDELSNNSQSFFLHKPFKKLDFTFEYSHESISEFNQSFDSQLYYYQLGIELSDTTYTAFSYQFQGNTEELENEQYQLLWEYSPYPAFMSLGLMNGGIDIFTSEARRAVLDIPSKVSSDVHSYTLGLGWWFDTFALSVKHQSYDYQRDLSVFSTRPILLLLVKPAALAQSGILVSEQSSISLTYPFTSRTLSGHILRSVSALDNTQNQSFQFDWNEQMNQDIDITLSVIYSDETQNTWSFSAGMTWQV